MKKIFMLLTAGLLLCCNYNAMAQTQKKQTDRKKTAVKQKAPAPAAERENHDKPINTGTTGVMGRDTIRLNEKGLELNQNYNTGTDLPPSDGTNNMEKR